MITKLSGAILATSLSIAACDRPSTDAPAGSAAAAASSAPTSPPMAAAPSTSATASAIASAAPKPPWKETTAPASSAVGVLAPGTGIAVGQKVPDVHAKDLDGKDVALSALYAKGSVLLAFYRGGWCPYCSFEIHSLVKAYPEYTKRGVTPVAISVDTPENEAKTNATFTIPFPVLSDESLAFINGFHVAKTLDAAEYAKYKGFGVDLESYSGKPHHVIAVPALFLVDKTGRVRWAHSDPSYTVRPSTEQILAAIDAAKLAK